MTKDSKDAHISDSASGGKGEGMVRESRSTKWTAAEPLAYNAHQVTGFIEVAAPNDACFTALFPLRKDADDYIAWKNSEKGLASRVEELEKCSCQRSKGECCSRCKMTKTVEEISQEMVLKHGFSPDVRLAAWSVNAAIAKAVTEALLLAGAHAEEKE